MSRIEKTIEVEAPLTTVYGQWTQFESFPEFMDGVTRVEQVDDRTLTWEAEIGGRTRTWMARVTDQTPDVRIAWMTIDGAQNDGAVTFRPITDRRTEVRLVIDADPDGIIEEVGDRLGFLDRRVEGDPERFKAFIEARGIPTGRWDGEIHGDAVSPGTRIDATGSSTADLHHGDLSDERHGAATTTRASGDARS
ncbi:MAG: SRPBCC family protein [Chloroflexi bacterium]|nr:SRPBCC family protein [Chloroflexota bacterium]